LILLVHGYVIRRVPAFHACIPLVDSAGLLQTYFFGWSPRHVGSSKQPSSVFGNRESQSFKSSYEHPVNGPEQTGIQMFSEQKRKREQYVGTPARSQLLRACCNCMLPRSIQVLHLYLHLYLDLQCGSPNRCLLVSDTIRSCSLEVQGL
jgi:hypothetical protein